MSNNQDDSRVTSIAKEEKSANEHGQDQDHTRVNSITSTRVIRWIFFKVVIPLLVIFLIYPINLYSLKLANPFVKAFAHGDLLIFSALILIEATIEGEQIDLIHWKFHLGRYIAMVLIFVSLIFFAVVKLDIGREEVGGDHIAMAPDLAKMYIYSCLGWFMAILSGIISIFTFWYSTYKELTRDFEQIRSS